MAEGSSSQQLSPQQSLDSNFLESQKQTPASLQSCEPTDVHATRTTYPAFIPFVVPPQRHEGSGSGAGVYAVPVHLHMGPVSGIPFDNLIPLTYSVPSTRYATPAQNGGTVEDAGMQEQLQQPQQHLNQQQHLRPQHVAPEEGVVRRFHIELHIDLLLILKLAAIIFLFNQDGSRKRLVGLILCAAFVYLYQTGVLTPLIRRLSRGVQRAEAPPPPPQRLPPQAENIPHPPPIGNVGAGGNGLAHNMSHVMTPARSTPMSW